MYLFDLPNVFVWIETCICPIVTLVWSSLLVKLALVTSSTEDNIIPLHLFELLLDFPYSLMIGSSRVLFGYPSIWNLNFRYPIRPQCTPVYCLATPAVVVVVPQQAPGRGHVWSRSVNMSARCQHKYGLIVQHWIDHYWCVTLLQLLLHSDAAAQIWSYSPRPDWSQLICCYTVIILYSIIFMFLCWIWMFKCHHSEIKMFKCHHIVLKMFKCKVSWNEKCHEM